MVTWRAHCVGNKKLARNKNRLICRSHHFRTFKSNSLTCIFRNNMPKEATGWAARLPPAPLFWPQKRGEKVFLETIQTITKNIRRYRYARGGWHPQRSILHPFYYWLCGLRVASVWPQIGEVQISPNKPKGSFSIFDLVKFYVNWAITSITA